MQLSKVLSLFDGIACLRAALEKAGVEVGKFYASEIDKYAIEIAINNYADIIEVGDIRHIKSADFTNIDLMCGGFPCQDLSVAKRNRQGLGGSRSSLFREYVRLLNEIKPRYFILENVNSMSKEAKQIITETLGIKSTMINASLVSAQQRKRLFWVSSRSDLCYNCKYEQLLKKIQYKGKVRKAQKTGDRKLLSETSKKENKMQNLRAEVLSSKYNSKMLLQKMYDYQQETERQEEQTNSKIKRIPKGILQAKKERIARIFKKLSGKQQRKVQEVLSKIQFQSHSKNEESTERGVEEKQQNYKYDWERGIIGYVEKDKHKMFVLQFYGGFNSRPYNPNQQGWEERFRKLTTPMSKLQFLQKGQVNICSHCGGIIPIYYKQVDIPQPTDRHIYVKDILENGYTDRNKSLCVTATYSSAYPRDYFYKHSKQLIFNKPFRVGKIGKGGQGERIYSIDGKSICLSAHGGGGGAKTGLYAIKDYVRKLTPLECERLQGLPDNYTAGISNAQRYKCIGNAFNVDVMAHILSFINEEDR